jgi:hypothetical protein
MSVVFTGYSVFSTNTSDRHDISEIVLKVALNTITPNQTNMLVIVLSALIRFIVSDYPYDIFKLFLNIGIGYCFLLFDQINKNINIVVLGTSTTIRIANCIRNNSYNAKVYPRNTTIKKLLLASCLLFYLCTILRT